MKQAACQKGFTVAFTTAAALVNQLTEARDEKRLLKTQRDLAAVKLLIVDELNGGGAIVRDLLAELRAIVTSNLPFEDWTQVLGSERFTGAPLDRLTHHVSILTMNGDSFRLKKSARRAAGTE
nr:ATP-binding protein [Sphingobium sp. EM0848]